MISSKTKISEEDDHRPFCAVSSVFADRDANINGYAVTGKGGDLRLVFVCSEI